MRGRADHKALAVAWLNTAHPVDTRREGDAFALLQVAAAQGLGVEPLNVEFMLAVRLELVAQARQLATAPEAVIRAGGLPAIGVVIRAGQAAGHVGFTIVILQQAVEGVHLIRRIFAFQHQVVDAGGAVLAPVTAARAGVEQRGAKTVVRCAAHHQVVRLFRVVL